ncbi:MAG: hypothetical protein LBJ67_16475 [Planctomycetaceae bacterium]|jgi:hypothetical protein|nr:hypothetical protein [Planctomycetaceae bacterium]
MLRTYQFCFAVCLTLFALSWISAQELIAPNNAKKLENYQTSWIGNSFGGLENGRGKWVQQDIAAMCVTDDGTVYTNVPWEEAGGNCSMYKDGQMLGSARHTHGWGFNGGKAVAVNDQYVYIALSGNNENGRLDDLETWPPKGFKWYGVSRRLRSDFTQGAPFDNGKGGKGDTLPKSFLVVNEVPEGKREENGQIINDDSAAIAGLYADNSRLYIANPHANAIEIYDAETMQKITQWNVPEEFAKDMRQIAFDSNGNLWVLLKRPRETLLAGHFLVFDKNGKLFTKRKPGRTIAHCPIEIPENQEENFPHNFLPSAFCFDNEGRLLVAASGIWRHILFLEQNGFDYVWADNSVPPTRLMLGIPLLARKDGYFAEQSFSNITAIGADAHGNIYVASDWATNGGGTILESYSFAPYDAQSTAREFPQQRENFNFNQEVVQFLSRWKLNWRLFGLEFIDCATLDPDDETLAFTKEERFQLDYSKPTGEEAKFLGGTILRFDSRWLTEMPHNDYKDVFRAPRINIKDSAGVWVRNLAGKRMLFVNDMNGSFLQVVMPDSDEQHVAGVAVALFSQRRVKDRADWLPGQPEKGEWIWRNSFSTSQQLFMKPKEFQSQENDAPMIEGWWVDFNGDIWQATLKDGIRRFRFQGLDNVNNPIWNYENLDVFPHPAEFKQVKRIRYDAASDTLYLGGCAVVDEIEHKNQHWKPMGAVVCRYDHFLKGDKPGSTEGKLRWKIVLPYVTGSQGHESCEPMGFDIAGEYMFVPYTGASKVAKFSTGHVEVYKLDDASPIGFMEPDPKTVGEIGLQDMRECLSAHRRSNGEYIIFLEDDYKAKVVMYRFQPETE